MARRRLCAGTVKGIEAAIMRRFNSDGSGIARFDRNAVLSSGSWYSSTVPFASVVLASRIVVLAILCRVLALPAIVRRCCIAGTSGLPESSCLSGPAKGRRLQVLLL
jgi:hypothetical protein